MAMASMGMVAASGFSGVSYLKKCPQGVPGLVFPCFWGQTSKVISVDGVRLASLPETLHWRGSLHVLTNRSRDHVNPWYKIKDGDGDQVRGTPDHQMRILTDQKSENALDPRPTPHHDFHGQNQSSTSLSLPLL
jgi:hypothetical protein